MFAQFYLRGGLGNVAKKWLGMGAVDDVRGMGELRRGLFDLLCDRGYIRVVSVGWSV